jgi:hypothetical protein
MVLGLSTSTSTAGSITVSALAGSVSTGPQTTVASAYVAMPVACTRTRRSKLYTRRPRPVCACKSATIAADSAACSTEPPAIV